MRHHADTARPQTVRVVSLLAVVVVMAGVVSATAAETASTATQERVPALIVLATDSLVEMRTAFEILEARGVRPRVSIAPAVISGDVDPTTVDRLRELPFVDLVSTEPVSPGQVKRSLPPLGDAAVRIVSDRLAGREPLSENPAPHAGDLEAPFEEPPRFDTTDRDLSPEMKRRLEARRQEARDALQARETDAIRMRCDREHPGRDLEACLAATFGADAGRLTVKHLEEISEGVPSVYGGSDKNLAQFLIGHSAAPVFFIDGDEGALSQVEMETELQRVSAALDELSSFNDDAEMAFTLVPRIDDNGVPAPPPVPEDYSPCWDRGGLDHESRDLRNTLGTSWGFAIVIEHTPKQRACASFGSHMWIPSGADHRTIQHEVLHVFNALDQYAAAYWSAPTLRSGCLHVVNHNSVGNDGTGLFGGAGEGQPDIMRSSFGDLVMTAFTRGQIGWRDADGDGRYDPIDTNPTTTVSAHLSPGATRVAGVAQDLPHHQECRVVNQRTPMLSTNTIAVVEIRIDDGSWMPAEPADGGFDYGREEWFLDLPELPVGTHAVEARAINSVGNVQRLPTRKVVEITASSTPDFPPIASFEMNPAMPGTPGTVVLDGSESWDLETGRHCLAYRWDVGDDGSWDSRWTRNPIFRLSRGEPASVRVRLEVRDPAGLVSHIVRSVETAASIDLAEIPIRVSPTALFHGDGQVTFHLGSERGPAPEGVMFDVDVDGDGTWELEGLPPGDHVYAYPLGSRSWTVQPVIAVVAADGTRLEVRRDVWAVPYDRRPTAAGATHRESGGLKYRERGSHSFAGTSGYPADGAQGVIASAVTGESPGLEIVDIRDPVSPVTTAVISTPRVSRLTVVPGTIFAFGGCQVIIVDTSDPEAPKVLSTLQVCDGDPYLGPPESTHYDRLKLHGRLLFVWTGETLEVIDVSDREAPTVIGRGLWVNEPLSRAAFHENAAYSPGKSLEIIDMADPSQPRWVKTWWHPDDDTDHPRAVFLTAQDGIAYLFHWWRGLRGDVLDLSDPWNPERLMTVDLGPAWGDNWYDFTGFVYRDLVIWRAWQGRDDDTRHRYLVARIGDRDLATLHALPEMWEGVSEGGLGWRIDWIDGQRGVVFGELRIVPVVEVVAPGDPNLDTTWDGLLEYRWDLDGDGVFDTPWDRLDNVMPIDPDVDRAPGWAPVVEVRDRFGATAGATLSTADPESPFPEWPPEGLIDDDARQRACEIPRRRPLP